MTNNIDFTTMKKWVPDYANLDSTNLFSGTTSATMVSDGFITIYLNVYNSSTDTDVSILINNKSVYRQQEANRSGGSTRVANIEAFFEVSAGDVVTYTLNSSTTRNAAQCNFIPGRWV